MEIMLQVVRGLLFCAALLALPARSADALAATSQSPAYFPDSEFSDIDDFASDRPEMTARCLRALDEPVLHADESLRFALRLTIYSAFRGGAVVRVEERENGARAGRFVRFDIGPGNVPSPIVQQGAMKVSPFEIAELRRAVSGQNLWQMSNKQDTIASDGSIWMLEIKDGKKFRALSRSWPHEGGVFEIGQLLLRKAGMPLFDR